MWKHTGSLQVTVERECERMLPTSNFQQFLKYIVCASFCIKAGTPETEMFLPVFIVLPQAAAVPSVLLLTDALAFVP